MMITKFCFGDVQFTNKARHRTHNHDHNSRWVEHVRPNWSLNTDMICGSTEGCSVRNTLSPMLMLMTGLPYIQTSSGTLCFPSTHTQRVFIATLMYSRLLGEMLRPHVSFASSSTGFLCEWTCCWCGCPRWRLNMRHHATFSVIFVCVCIVRTYNADTTRSAKRLHILYLLDGADKLLGSWNPTSISLISAATAASLLYRRPHLSRVARMIRNRNSGLFKIKKIKK